MPVCFLVTKDEKILYEKEAALLNIDELEEIINIVLQELEDIYKWEFEIENVGSIKEVSYLKDRINGLDLRIFMKQFCVTEDYRKGGFRGLSENSANLSVS